MDKVAYGTWQISEINKQQTNSVEYKCSAKSNHGMVVMHARLTDGLPLGLQRGGKNFLKLSRIFFNFLGIWEGFWAIRLRLLRINQV